MKIKVGRYTLHSDSMCMWVTEAVAEARQEIARMKGADDYERAIEQMEHDMLYEPTYNSEDGSM